MEKKRNYLFVKCVFCPNDKYFNISFNSIINLIDYCNFHDIQIDLLIIGWLNNHNRENYEKIFREIYILIHFQLLTCYPSWSETIMTEYSMAFTNSWNVSGQWTAWYPNPLARRTGFSQSVLTTQ